MIGDESETNYSDFKEQLLQDPEVKGEYDALESEFDAIQDMIDVQKKLK